MEKLVILAVLVLNLFGAKVVHLDEKYQNSKKCFSCHSHIIKDWQNSQHSKSHYKKDEFYKKAVDYVSRKEHQPKELVLIECAKCHNPRIEVGKVSEDDEAVIALGLADQKFKKAVNSKTIAEGINCLVCHNIDKIHYNAPLSVRGMDRVEWNKNGIMSGPFSDADSPYHKTQYREFFDKDPNKLCFVCHAATHSMKNEKLYFADMKKNYVGNEKCIDCHMGPKIKGYASTFSKNGKVKQRMIRHHKFIGPHTRAMLKDTLKIDLKKEKNYLYISLINNLPHSFPTGCGSRELIIDVTFRYKKTLKKKTISLTTYYKRKNGRKSIPHIATNQTQDLQIPPKSKKTFKLKLPQKGFDTIIVKVFYKLANDEIVNMLKLKEPKWSQKRLITFKSMKI